MRDGRLPCIHVGRHVRFLRTNLAGGSTTGTESSSCRDVDDERSYVVSGFVDVGDVETDLGGKTRVAGAPCLGHVEFRWPGMNRTMRERRLTGHAHGTEIIDELAQHEQVDEVSEAIVGAVDCQRPSWRALLLGRAARSLRRP